jgi:hypothetical protein
MKPIHAALGILLAMLIIGGHPSAWAQASVLSKAVRTRQNMEPALAYPDQEKAAAKKLDDLYAKTGKRPNIVWLIVDDMGWAIRGFMAAGQSSALPRPTWTAWHARA